MSEWFTFPTLPNFPQLVGIPMSELFTFLRLSNFPPQDVPTERVVSG